MIKLMMCLRRQQRLDREAFQRYWREVHARVVEKRREALRVQRYVQVHTLERGVNAALQASRGGPFEFDGVDEYWFESVDDMVEAFSSPEGQRAAEELLDDQRTFVDLARSPLWIAEEKTIIGN